jgi:hypothetical protein
LNILLLKEKGCRPKRRIRRAIPGIKDLRETGKSWGMTDSKSLFFSGQVFRAGMVPKSEDFGLKCSIAGLNIKKNISGRSPPFSRKVFPS